MSPTRRELVRATRTRIVDAAGRLTRDRGASGFSMDVLAKEAGVARATVYEHFRSKRSVLDELASSIARTVTMDEGRIQAGDPLVRTILGIDEAAQSLTFAGDMPQGGVARLMRANTDKLVDSAGQAARAGALGVSGVDDSLVISVSCVGRRLVLGERTEEEVEIVHDSAPKSSGHVGFYSYGEISPHSASGICQLHNQTMTVTAITESVG